MHEDLVGQKFGRWRVNSLNTEPRKQGQKLQWNCSCDCGVTAKVDGGNLKSRRSLSCGCLMMEVNKTFNVTHNASYTATYFVWSSMVQRCTNPNVNNYHNYGERGIAISDDWLLFENFRRDMGEKPKGKTLDREDNSKGYSLSNCRWSTPKEQSRNTRVNILMTYKDKTQCLAEWCDELNLSYQKTYLRIKRYKWSVEAAFETP